MIIKQKHHHIKLENECLCICQLQRPPRPTSLHAHPMGHTASLLYTIPELKSDRLIDHKRMLFVWHLIDDRLPRCPDQLPNAFWPRKPWAREVESKDPPVAKGNIKQSNAADSSDCTEKSHITTPSECNVWRGLPKPGWDTHYKDGDMKHWNTILASLVFIGRCY